MTLAEKAEVLAAAGFTTTDDVCKGVKCEDCIMKVVTDCQMMFAVQKLIKAGYDVVIQ